MSFLYILAIYTLNTLNSYDMYRERKKSDPEWHFCHKWWWFIEVSFTDSATLQLSFLLPHKSDQVFPSSAHKASIRLLGLIHPAGNSGLQILHRRHLFALVYLSSSHLLDSCYAREPILSIIPLIYCVSFQSVSWIIWINLSVCFHFS